MKIALITGATSGIGEALAHVFAKNQTGLILVSRDREKLQRTSEELTKSYKIPVHIFAVDLSEKDAAQKVYDFVREKNLDIDFLVNNAGVGDYGEFCNIDTQKMDTMMELNIGTLTRLTRVFLPGMIARKGGKVLNLASTASFQPGPLMAVYFATKAYVLNFSLAIAKELEETGVTITALCPGPTASSFSHAASVGKSKLFANKTLPTAQEVAEFGYDSMMNEKKVAIHGIMNSIKAWSVKFLPRERMLTEMKKAMQHI